MKKNGKAPKNIYAQRTIAQAREQAGKMKFVATMTRVHMRELIKNARAAQACVDALNISAAEECLEQIFLRAGGAKNNLQQLREMLK